MKKRCDMCSKRRDLFAYDGFKLCSGCKSNMRSCDGNGKSAPVKAAKSRAQHESQRMMAAKNRW